MLQRPGWSWRVKGGFRIHSFPAGSACHRSLGKEISDPSCPLLTAAPMEGLSSLLLFLSQQPPRFTPPEPAQLPTQSWDLPRPLLLPGPASCLDCPSPLGRPPALTLCFLS
jgi:hypothetical protein